MIATAKSSARKAVPAHFENGDMLTLNDFLRRYERMPNVKKAELIEGVIHMASPVRINLHSRPDGIMQGWLFAYAAMHDLEMFPNTTLLLDVENCFQPDSMLCSKPRKGGRVWVNKDDYLCGSPELVVEIAASSVSIDLRDKLRAYRRAEIAEYIVWRTEDAEIDWFVLDDGQYIKQTADKHGKIHSRIFKGLTLDVNAALACNKAKVLSALGK
jgi:Uma2 family endonuclease